MKELLTDLVILRREIIEGTKALGISFSETPSGQDPRH